MLQTYGISRRIATAASAFTSCGSKPLVPALALSTRECRFVSSNSRSSNYSMARLTPLPPTGTMTKIVCTIGPATDARIDQLIANGMHVARLNFSHAGSDYAYPEMCMDLVRSTPGKHGSILATGSMTTGTATPPNVRAVLVDTKGPEIRTGVLQGNQDVVEIAVGDTVELTTREVAGDDIPAKDAATHRIQVDYMSIAKSLKVGSQVLLDDGLIALEVVQIDAIDAVTCKALNGGPIKKNKGVNLPGIELDLPALTEKDKRDLAWAVRVGADFVAASFIRTASNVRSVTAYLDRCVAAQPATPDGKPALRPLVISKIESKEGVDNFKEILAESDGIMVARGDLGVEIPYSQVFRAQKMMVSLCNEAGKPVIVATQMLDSMMRNPRPTRAEVTDVGTAVLDGADAVMLSGETAAGKYPIESIKAMGSVVYEADQIQDATSEMIWNQDLHDGLPPLEQDLDAVCASAVKSAKKMKAGMIVCITMSGRVARSLTRHRPTVPVLALCTDAQVARRLQLHRSVTPIMLQSTLDPGAKGTRMGLLRAEAMRTIKELGFAKAGDRIIMVDRTAGKDHDMHEFAHNMKVITLR